MNWKTSLAFGLLLLLFFWSLETQQRAARDKHLADSTAAAEDSIAKAVQQASASKPSSTPELRALPPTNSAPDLAAAASGSAASSLAADTVRADSAVPVPPAPHRSIVVENDRFVATFDSRGALLRSLVLKSLSDTAGKYPELLLDTSRGALALQYDSADFSIADFAVEGQVPDHVEVGAGGFVLRFVWSDAQGRRLERSYSFAQSSDSIGIKAKFHGFAPRTWTLRWDAGMRETEPFLHATTIGPAGYFFSEVVLNNTYNVQRETPKEHTFYNKDQGKLRWAGLRRKYSAVVVDFKGESEATVAADPMKGSDKDDHGSWALSINDYVQSDSLDFNLIAMPLVHKDLEAKGEMFEKILFSGWEWIGADKWFVWLAGVILWILNAFYGLVPNYGIAIILLTLLVKFATLPFTIKQLKSTRELQRHKPEIDAIRTRNRANPTKMQQELMEYYRRTGMNPLAPMTGCFTMILQMPIFIALFVVLGRAVELRRAPFFGWIHDLSHADVVWSGFSIPYIMPLGLSLLPLIMAFTTWYQMKQTITDPQQKAMIWMMPIMMLLFSGVMPSGLVVYWIVGNLFSIAQYFVLNKGHFQPVPEAPAATDVKYKKVRK